MVFVQKKTWLMVGALAMLAMPVRAADTDKLLPADSEVVITLNVQQLLESPLVKKYAEEQIKAALQKDDNAGKVLKELGFDPLKDLSSITVASPSLAENKKGLIIIHGKFDTEKFHAKAEEIAKANGEILKVHKAGKNNIYETKAMKNLPRGQGQGGPLFVGLLSNDTMVAAPTQAGVETAFAGDSKSLNKEMQALLGKTDGKQSLSVAVLGSALGKLPGNNERAKDFISKLLSVTSVITVDSDVKAEVVLNAKNADSAKDLSGEIKEGLDQVKMIVQFLITNQPELAPVADVLETIKIDSKGGAVTIKSHLDADFIQKAIPKKKS